MNSINGIGSHTTAIQFGARRHQKTKIITPMQTIIEKPESGDDDSIPEKESLPPFSLPDSQEGDTIWTNWEQEPPQNQSVHDSAEDIVPTPPALTRQKSINPYYSSEISAEISAISSPRSLDQSPERGARPWNIMKIRSLPMRSAGLMPGAEAPNAFRNSANPFLSPTQPQPNAPQNTRSKSPESLPKPNQQNQPD
jgi:hypothetical protein